MDSTDLVTPLAETIGVLWNECEKAGKTKEALLQFKDRLRALRILIGNCNCPFLGVVLCNHMASVESFILEHAEKL
jgi:hypothetical protein